MRWSIIRLIWLRELRDQLRDRRTLFMIVVLPLLLYPVLGFLVVQFAFGFAEKPSVIGIEKATTAAAEFPLLEAGFRREDYPQLFGDTEETRALLAQAKLKIVWLSESAEDALHERRVDLILRAPQDFYRRLEHADARFSEPRPAVDILSRPDDDHSKQALHRLRPLLEQWRKDLQRARLARRGLVEEPFVINEPPAAPPAESVLDMVVRLFPFMLVMWSLAGALYPAVDLCAGEKERGTMETLLITPAGREEIVLGKFLTIWVFSAASAVLNLISMGISTWQLSGYLPQGQVPIAALLWCVVLSLPLSALFSAISLAIGAYARSSKEGQYYLMPLFFITMPLIFLTLAPGVELNPFYSLVPVTGVALLMQKLMTATALEQVPWLYFIPVLVPIGLYSWLALRWAIEQFQREEVLFREAERVDIRLWLRHLLRDKEPTPSAAQAFFLFGLILGLRWLAMGLGRHLSIAVFTSVNLLAFVASPVLLITIMLNTQPAASLGLRWPKWREVGLAALLAVLLLPPFAGLAVTVLSEFPHLTKLLEDRQPLVQSLRTLIEGQELRSQDIFPFLIAFAVLPAVCEELAFRGFLLTGLLKRFRPRTAILLCSFLFALFHMNVFQFLPQFFLGVVLGLLTVRSKSILPAMFFHLLYNGVLLLSVLVKHQLDSSVLTRAAPYLMGICFAIALGLLWWLYRKPYVELARKIEMDVKSPR